MDVGPRIGSYAWAGGRETMLRWGPDNGRVVVLALPLFEEANRTRAFSCTVLRALAKHSVGGVLPELPGQGESLVSTQAATLAGLCTAFAAVAGGSHVLAIRSGALLIGDAMAAGRWLLAPQSGTDLLRELGRIHGAPLTGDGVVVAGNVLSGTMLGELAQASGRFGTGTARTIRLASDPGAADRHIDGTPVWRRVEPDNDLSFAQLLADDIADWLATCAG